MMISSSAPFIPMRRGIFGPLGRVWSFASLSSSQDFSRRATRSRSSTASFPPSLPPPSPSPLTSHHSRRLSSLDGVALSVSRRLPVVDLRSDTVTSPTSAMLRASASAATGDDVMGEDPTVNALEAYAADLFGKERALFVPTCTMANLCAVLSHCHYNRSAEIILGKRSHINLYEGGGYANVAGASVKLIDERSDGTFDLNDVRDAFRMDDDDHYAKTTLVCLENTHNMLGGVALPPSYVDVVSELVRSEWGPDAEVKIHVDGARIFNAAASLGERPADLARGADSVSVCLSKGLGAPLGAILVGGAEFVRLARRARKRLGGGMRQAGVVAAMGMHALLNHVDRLCEDNARANRLATGLRDAGFEVVTRDDGRGVAVAGGEGIRRIIDTNIVFFALPPNSRVTKEELPALLEEGYNIKIAGGYSKGGRMFRLVTHLDVDDEGVERTLEGICSLCLG